MAQTRMLPTRPAGDVTRDMMNPENGYWTIMAEPMKR